MTQVTSFSKRALTSSLVGALLTIGALAIDPSPAFAGSHGFQTAGGDTSEDVILNVNEESRIAIEGRRLLNRRTRGSSEFNGTLVINGEPSPLQFLNEAKVVRCNFDASNPSFVAQRRGCDPRRAISIGLNRPESLAAGSYLLGFENTLFPGVILIQPGTTTRIDLAKIQIPSAPANAEVRIYRDLANLNEQLKMYFSTYTLGENFYAHSVLDAGYLLSRTPIDLQPLAYRRVTQSFCEQSRLPEMTPRAAMMCRGYNLPTFMGMSVLFDFKEDGRHIHYEAGNVTSGAAFPVNIGRLLVGAPGSTAQRGFVNVLPGVYKIEIRQNGRVVSTTRHVAGTALDQNGFIPARYGAFPSAQELVLGRSSQPALAAMPAPGSSSGDTEDDGEEVLAPGQTCQSARAWRTEWRSHCTGDNQSGCNRGAALVCEIMNQLN